MLNDTAAPNGLFTDDGHTARCVWCRSTAEYQRYHDQEWGFPVHSDTRLFEKICLEGFQAGLSWLTILNKRESFRTAFAGFDMDKVALYFEYRRSLSSLPSRPRRVRSSRDDERRGRGRSPAARKHHGRGQG